MIDYKYLKIKQYFNATNYWFCRLLSRLCLCPNYLRVKCCVRWAGPGTAQFAEHRKRSPAPAGSCVLLSSGELIIWINRHIAIQTSNKSPVSIQSCVL